MDQAEISGQTTFDESLNQAVSYDALDEFTAFVESADFDLLWESSGHQLNNI